MEMSQGIALAFGGIRLKEASKVMGVHGVRPLVMLRILLAFL
jgi:hypothetical protein